MSTYLDTIYPNGVNDYDEKLCLYLIHRFNLKGKLLDLGCGTGKHARIFKKSGLLIKMIDKPKIDLEYGKLPYKKNYFDVVFCKSVIEHINNPDNMMIEIYRVLKKGGKFIILTPDWKSQMTHFWDDYTHVHPYTLKSLKDLLLIYRLKNVSAELFYQRTFVWKYPWLKFLLKIIALCPQSWKWKTKEMRNGQDRKWIRFAKEKMILAWGEK